MITVYELLRDPEFQELYSDHEGPSLPDEWPGEGVPISTSWPTPPTYVPEPLLKEPDVYYFEQSFAFKAAAFKVVESILRASGEILEVILDEHRLYVPNVTQVVDCLDHARLTYYLPGNSAFIKDMYFKPEMLPLGLFKVPESPQRTFVVTGAGSPSDLKGLVEVHRITGIRFDRLWSQED